MQPEGPAQPLFDDRATPLLPAGIAHALKPHQWVGARFAYNKLVLLYERDEDLQAGEGAHGRGGTACTAGGGGRGGNATQDVHARSS